jgi:hypothetical protein
MNNQVRNYFTNLKVKSIINVIENHYVNRFIEQKLRLFSEMAVGRADSKTIQLSDEELAFADLGRDLFREQNPEVAPPAAWKFVAAKFALLHPSPIHSYSIEKDDNNVWKMYETDDNEEVATINPTLRSWYKISKQNNNVPKEILEIEKEDHDEAVMRWWKHETENALLEAGKENSSPYVKIVQNGSEAVLSFKKAGPGKGYVWHTVKIPVDTAKWRKELEEKQGFNDKTHLKNIVKFRNKTWESLIGDHPETLKAAFKNDKKRHIVPGHHEKVSNQSKTFVHLFNDDREFRNFIESHFITAVRSAIPHVTAGNKRAGISKGPSSLEYKITQMDPGTVEDIIVSARTHFMDRTGEIKDEVWANWRDTESKEKIEKWIKGVAAGSARTVVTHMFNKLVWKTDETGRKYQTRVFDQEKANMTIGRGTGGQVDSDSPQYDPMDQASKDASPVDQAIDREEPQKQELDYDQLLKLGRLLKRGPEVLKNREVFNHVKQYADDPYINNILIQQGIDLNKIEKELEGGATLNVPAGDSTGDKSRYGASSVAHENQSPYSFKQYLDKRINEMGVVFGSSRKMKPGQTLKGGIQVQGAPWSAGGGPNYKDNDLKIK